MKSNFIEKRDWDSRIFMFVHASSKELRGYTASKTKKLNGF